MILTTYRFHSALLLVLFTGASLSSRAFTASGPNIVFIMADDMGHGDARCFNGESKIPTPNIDRLAKDGIRFTDAHAPAAVCVPTRYGLMTGRYPFRMTRLSGPLIAPGRLTVARLLKTEGYTTACVGKWHLGFENQKNPRSGQRLAGGPLDHGFDQYFGIPASLDQPPYYYIENDRCVAAPSERIEASDSPGWTSIQGAFWRSGGIAPGFKHADVLPKFTEKAIAFLAEREPSKPFFLYVALAGPHTPWLPHEKFVGKSLASMYGDFAHEVDHCVGEILDELDRRELTENTLVIFTSDNGPVWYPHDVDKYGHSSTGVLRGMKGDAWEGGHRVPFIARWPGKIRPGTKSSEVICHTDMLATFAAIVGRELPDDAGADSFDISPALLGKSSDKPLREATVFQSSDRVLAIRQGPWKLIPQLGSGGFSKPRRVKPEPGGPTGQLYDLEKDPPESKNVFLDHPEIVAKLKGLLERYRREGRSRPAKAGTK